MGLHGGEFDWDPVAAEGIAQLLCAGRMLLADDLHGRLVRGAVPCPLFEQFADGKVKPLVAASVPGMPR